jgi:hypothetical protein
MRFTFMAVSSLIFMSKIFGQTKVNKALKDELDSIFKVDQRYRLFIQSDQFKSKTDSLARKLKVGPGDVVRYMLSKMQENDSTNMKRVKEIIGQYGYPGKTLVGEPTNEAAFYVIQHSSEINAYLAVVEKAAKRKELPFMLYATMLDRSLLNKEKAQLYGTQTKGFEITDSVTGQKKWQTIIWPVSDAANVNKRRKQAGFDDSVEENARKLGLEYRPYSMEEIKRWRMPAISSGREGKPVQR